MRERNNATISFALSRVACGMNRTFTINRVSVSGEVGSIRPQRIVKGMSIPRSSSTATSL